MLLLLLAIWKLPQWYAASWDKLIEPKDIVKLESDTRTSMIQAVGGLVLLVGLFFTAKTWRTTHEGQITDRFTKAINQLGETGPEKLAIRLGGIYALERIARDSERDHWPIMEVLTAYVRETTSQEGYRPLRHAGGPFGRARHDVQAALTVLGRRNRTYDGEYRRIDLSSTNLMGINLVGDQAQLQGAILTAAHLGGAMLAGAHLEGALLFNAQLERTALPHAHLVGAHFKGADLRGAVLVGADLRGAVDLTLEQLKSAASYEGAQLPEYLREPFAPAENASQSSNSHDRYSV